MSYQMIFSASFLSQKLVWIKDWQKTQPEKEGNNPHGDIYIGDACKLITS